MKLQTFHSLAGGIIFCLLACFAIYLLFPKPEIEIEPDFKPAFSVTSNHEPFQFAVAANSHQVDFPIYWPPDAGERAANRTPLLNGNLRVSIGKIDGEDILNVRAELTRPESEQDRERWNQQLAFPEYDWMSRVRVWDKSKQWLWPNLPFLLRAHGIERQQRYGGVDPGKGVDNDFAAIVLKAIDSGGNESPTETLSAEWHGAPSGPVSKHSIVHQAVSDDLQLAIANQSKFAAWIIYADFLDSPPPRNWPDEPEFNGGILAYFTIRIDADENGDGPIIEAAFEQPTASTGIDWEQWRADH